MSKAACDLPGHIADVSDEIVDIAVICADSGKPFRFTAQELEFYRRIHFPVPGQHPDVRHRRRLGQRNARTLLPQNCARCSTAMLSTYKLTAKVSVLCDEYYQQLFYS